MKGEMRSYVVSVVFVYDDINNYSHLRFTTSYPVNSVGFWEDFYDVCFDSLDYSLCDSMRILEVEEGF